MSRLLLGGASLNSYLNTFPGDRARVINNTLADAKISEGLTYVQNKNRNSPESGYGNFQAPWGFVAQVRSLNAATGIRLLAETRLLERRANSTRSGCSGITARAV